MAPAPELASKDFTKVVDDLWRKNKDDYVDSPQQFFADINKIYDDKKLFVSMHSSEVVPGYLVSARCMVQNTLAPEYFPLSCTISDGAEKTEATGCLRDHFGDNIMDVIDHGSHGCRNCYKMIMVPGAADWWIEEFNQNHTTALCRRDDGIVQRLFFLLMLVGYAELMFYVSDQMDTDTPGPAPSRISEFIAKVFDDGTPELKPNAVVDVYGYLSAPIHDQNDGEAQTLPPKHFNVHVLRITEVSHIPSPLPEALAVSDPRSIRSDLVREISEVLGSTAAADTFVNFLVSTTYSRPGGTPLCFLPLNVAGVPDSQSADSIITMLRHLMPKRFFPTKEEFQLFLDSHVFPHYNEMA
ncbi:hypothetical protein OESDEN_20419 [Oesophagostomum dentatum]|uniref:Mini-chromosome maintenance complex-binding protein n=1 Tax=Oesophagostomum dentatum TaxID=61180 RepID=A0A0B1S4Q2_OESDE|nr:hypothetical protein OESDEN_20419 [Oesophagostomum dentatum]